MINPDHFIFIHVAKTAGSSIEVELTGDMKLGNHNNISHRLHSFRKGIDNKYYFPRNSHHSTLKDHLLYKGYTGNEFIFTFIRNPWCRAYSLWKYLVKYRAYTDSFIQSVKSLRFQNHLETHSYKTLMTTYESNIDFIGKYENLQSDWLTVCKHLNIKNKPLRKINVGIKHSYKEAYDDESISIIEELLRDEVNLGTYTY